MLGTRNDDKKRREFSRRRFLQGALAAGSAAAVDPKFLFGANPAFAGPPLGPSVDLSSRVRSGLIDFHVAPASLLENTFCAATSNSLSLTGENRTGCVQPKRYRAALAAEPDRYVGHEVTLCD